MRVLLIEAFRYFISWTRVITAIIAVIIFFILAPKAGNDAAQYIIRIGMKLKRRRGNEEDKEKNR